MGEWINFKELRSRLEFRKVLDHYGVELEIKGNQATGQCPLPTHGGDKRASSFSANLERGIWQCFKCRARGNVLDFAVRMEGKLPDNAAALREVALGLQEWLGMKTSKPSEAKQTPRAKSTARPPSRDDEPLLVPAPEPDSSTPSKATVVRVNAPLDFELKGVQPEHPYLLGRGFTAKTIWKFGLGYFARGLMAGRVVIPLRDTAGMLVGYAGRLVDDSKVTKSNPKYLFPASRDRDGVMYKFRKSLLLYNGERLKGPLDHLVVVEGFPSVWWLDQAGIPNVVATMGSSCSKEQAESVLALTAPNACITIVPDGDEAGGRFRDSVFEAVGLHRRCRWVCLPSGRQPTDIPADVLKKLLKQ